MKVKNIISKFAIFLFIVLLMWLGISVFFNKTNKIEDTTAEKDEVLYGFFPESKYINEKYPEIKDYIKNINQYFDKNAFNIKRNDEGYLGVYNENGNLVIPHEYKDLEYAGFEKFYQIFFKSKKGSNYKLIDYKNNTILEGEYQNIICSACGITVEKDNKMGLISYSGKTILNPEFDNITCQQTAERSDKRYFIAQKGDYSYVFDNDGKELVSEKQVKITPYLPGKYFRIEKNNKIGVIDSNGKTIVKPKYYSVMNPAVIDGSTSFTVCKKENKCGTVNSKGRKELPFKFANGVWKFSKNCYAVRLPNKNYVMVLVKKSGRRIGKGEYNSIYPLGGHYLGFTKLNQKGDKIGVMDYKGNIIIPLDFDIDKVVSVSDNDLIKIKKDGKYGVFYKDRIILKPVYNRVFFFRGHILILSNEENIKYYYVSTLKDFAKNKGNLKLCKKYFLEQYMGKVNDKCFRFLNNDSSEDLYCSKSKN